MSLKATIEAVIYAAEEPVTLAQLAFLFGGEVLPSADASSDGPLPVDGTEASRELTSDEIELGISAEGAEPATPPNELPQGPPLVGDPGETEVASTEKSLPETATEAPDEKRASRARDRAIRESLKAIVTELIDEYSRSDRGMEIREIAGGYRIATKPEYHDAVRSFVKGLKPPMKLSLQALETLAVIAYKQPVTAPEVNEIRGVDSGGVLGGLMGRKLITTAGRKQVIGRPILYKTTKEFLLRFGLRDVNELPSIEEFEKMAGDMDIEDDTEEVQRSADLPFDGEITDAAHPGGPKDDTPAALDSAAVEANAGEAGVSVGTPVDDSPQADAEAPPPETIELDSHIAAETAPADHEAELITAVHPATTMGGE